MNPSLRSGEGKKIWRRLEKQLTSSGVEYEAHLTEKPEDVSDFVVLSTEGRKELRIIAAMDEDGTVNGMLSGLIFCGPITPDYIPTSSGNDLARGLKPPKRPGRCLKKILNPRYYELLDCDAVSYGLGEVIYYRSAVGASIGCDAAVYYNLPYSWLKWVLNKIHLDKLGHILIGVKQLALIHLTKGYLLLDGVQETESSHTYFVSAHIRPYEGGGFKFALRAKLADDMLDTCVVHNVAKRKLIPILVGAYLEGHINYCGVRHYACQETEIHTDKTMLVHVGGESCYCQSDLQIQCIEKKPRLTA